MRALVLAALAATAGAAQPADSLAGPVAAALPDSADATDERTPRGAVTRALLLPGLGQLYNRQPAKAPFASALVAGAVVYFVDRQRQYLLYRRATVYAGCLLDDGVPDDPDRIELCADATTQYTDEYDRLNEDRATPLTFATLRPIRDQARGQRDIGGVVVLAAYALQALDAYVSAELADFDVSDDLSVWVEPGPAGPALGLRVRL